MLNWIWLGLIIIAIAVATGTDISELSSHRFRNDQAISFRVTSITQVSPDHYSAAASITKADLQKFYDPADIGSTSDTLHLVIEFTKNNSAWITLPADAPKVWQDMATAGGDDKKISGKILHSDSSVLAPFYIGQDPAQAGISLLIIPDPVKFRVLAKVANDGLLKSADTAVTIALGLIGVMALWLGIMKIAEAAGLVLLLAKMAKPLMVRLFPDVPPEHPAMGAMLSNMAANFLGLSNAATPLGLKAMEELNTLNPVAGTATNAMCMFLTINTSAITLIPATVIAIRVSLNSKNPTDIIIPTFLATLVALICGVIFNKFIQRFFPVKIDD